MKIAVLTSSIGSTKLLKPKSFDGVDYHALLIMKMIIHLGLNTLSFHFHLMLDIRIVEMQKYIKFFRLLSYQIMITTSGLIQHIYYKQILKKLSVNILQIVT